MFPRRFCIEGWLRMSGSRHPEAVEFLLKVSLPKLLRGGIIKLIPHPLIGCSRCRETGPSISRVDRPEVHDLVINARDCPPDQLGDDYYRRAGQARYRNAECLHVRPEPCNALVSGPVLPSAAPEGIETSSLLQCHRIIGSRRHLEVRQVA
jgi:hypothetical protein